MMSGQGGHRSRGGTTATGGSSIRSTTRVASGSARSHRALQAEQMPEALVCRVGSVQYQVFIQYVLIYNTCSCTSYCTRIW